MTATTVFTDACTKYGQGDVLNWYLSGSIGVPIASDVDGNVMVDPVNLVTNAFTTPQVACMASIRFKITNTPGGQKVILNFFNGTFQHLYLGINASRQLLLVGPTGTTIATDTTTPLTVGQFYFIDVGVLVDDTVGRVEVRVNGTQLSALTSIALGGSLSNTLDSRNNGAAATIDRVLIGSSPAQPSNYDHIILRTATAVWTTPTDWPGLVKKKTVKLQAGSAGDGQYTAGTAWTVGVQAGGGTSHSDALRQLPFDGDGSYLNLTTVAGNASDRDSWKLEASPATVASIFCVSHIWMTKCTSSAATHKGFLYSPSFGGLFDNATTFTDTTSYKGRQNVYDQHPSAVAWTKTQFDELQLGILAVTISP